MSRHRLPESGENTLPEASGARARRASCVLALVGAAGVALSLVLVGLLVLDSFPLPGLAGAIVYVTGFVAIVIVTLGRLEGLVRLIVGLLAPLPAALLVWWALWALGL